MPNGFVWRPRALQARTVRRHGIQPGGSLPLQLGKTMMMFSMARPTGAEISYVDHCWSLVCFGASRTVCLYRRSARKQAAWI